MKALFLILAGAAAVFMGLAMAQEWAVFRPLFAGAARIQPGEALCPEQAEKTLEYFNTVLQHVYRYGGDPRFVDRLPASDRVKEEVARDLEYLAGNGVVQIMTKREFEVLGRRSLPGGACEFRTRETWALHYETPQGRRFDDKEMTWVAVWRYVIRKSVGGWEVAVMEPVHGS